jgi:hypothetical protein
MKFVMNIMPTDATTYFNFYHHTVSNTNMAAVRTCKVGSTLAPLNVGFMNSL